MFCATDSLEAADEDAQSITLEVDRDEERPLQQLGIQEAEKWNSATSQITDKFVS